MRGRWLPRAAMTVAVAVIVVGLASATPAAAQLRGVVLHPMASDQGASTITREFDLLQLAGADSIRFDVFWHAVQWSGPTDYEASTLAWLDWVFGQAQSHGLKVILDVWSTPCWASSAPFLVSLGCSWGWWNRGVTRYPPVNPQDYANFAAFAAKRWQSSLAAIELWNEPNGDFLQANDKAGAYARLVRAAYPAIKAIAPNLPVLINVAGTDTSFLSALYADGVRGYYDGIAVHPYDQPTFAGLKAFRAYQVGQGDTAPLWATEVGWSSTSVGLQAQATDVASALQQLAALPYVAAVEVYDMRDEDLNILNSATHYGLLWNTLYPKPAWSAFASSVKSFAGT